jgi:predicted RNase H-like nuclease
MRVVGVDGCRTGWVAAEIDDDGLVRVEHLPAIESLTTRSPTVEIAGIDIPVAFPPAGEVRDAKLAARAQLGPRRSSIFLTPPRVVLACETANQRARVEHGEVHPELSFAALLTRPAARSKRTWAGMTQRRVALDAAGPGVVSVSEAAGGAAVDDVLDAVVVAWTARRIRHGVARRFPTDPAVPDPDCIWA